MGEVDVSGQAMQAIRRIIRAIELHSRRMAQRHGLTGPQLVVLRELSRLPSTPVGDLARRVSLSHATVTDILDRLQVRGLVERSRDVEDHRRVLVRPTESAAALLQKVPTIVQERFSEQLSRLADWEQTLILSSLQRVASMMESEALTTEGGT